MHFCYFCLDWVAESLGENDLKELRADMKRTGEKLAKAHPNSESIKYGFTIAVMEAASSKEKEKNQK